MQEKMTKVYFEKHRHVPLFLIPRNIQDNYRKLFFNYFVFHWELIQKCQERKILLLFAKTFVLPLFYTFKNTY